MKLTIIQYTEYLVIATAFLLPFYPQAANLCGIIATLVWLTAIKKWDWQVFFSPIPACTTLLLINYLIGLLYTEHLSPEGFQSVIVKLPLLLFSLLFFSLPVLSKSFFERVLWAFSGGVLVAMLICFGRAILYFILGWGNYFLYANLSEALALHPTYLGVYILFSLYFVFFRAIEQYKETTNTQKKALSLFFLLSLYFIFALLSRSVWLSFVLITAAIWLIYRYENRKIKRGIVEAILSTSFLLSVLLIIPQTRSRLQKIFLVEKTSVEWTQDTRLMAWTAAQNTLANHYIIGVGTGDVVPEMMKEYAKYPEQPWLMTLRLNPHNQFLQTWLAIGISGLGLLILSLAIPFWHSIRKGWYIYTIFVSLCLIPNLTESMLERQHGVLFFAFLGSFLGAYFYKNNSNPTKKSNKDEIN